MTVDAADFDLVPELGGSVNEALTGQVDFDVVDAVDSDADVGFCFDI